MNHLIYFEIHSKDAHHAIWHSVQALYHPLAESPWVNHLTSESWYWDWLENLKFYLVLKDLEIWDLMCIIAPVDEFCSSLRLITVFTSLKHWEALWKDGHWVLPTIQDERVGSLEGEQLSSLGSKKIPRKVEKAGHFRRNSLLHRPKLFLDTWILETGLLYREEINSSLQRH